jgi:hypothetical protein
MSLGSQPKPAWRGFPRQGAFERDYWQRFARDPLATALDHTYVIEDRPLVEAFIKEHGLRYLLLEAVRPLNDLFRTDAVKTLRIISDDEGSSVLFCLVLTPGNLQDAQAALRNFDEKWWLSRSGSASGALNFDFELI